MIAFPSRFCVPSQPAVAALLSLPSLFIHIGTLEEEAEIESLGPSCLIPLKLPNEILGNMLSVDSPRGYLASLT